MAIETINVGSAPNDGTGDSIRTAFGKVNANFSEVDAKLPSSPLDEGAVGDGVADEAAELQDAIDAAAAAGRVCDLGGRTYRVDSGLDLPSGITIQNGTIDFSNAPASEKLFTATGTLLGNTSISGATRGSAGFTVTSATGIAENGFYFLRSTDAFGSGGTYRGEWVRCKTIVGASFTPYGRLDDTYTTTPTLYRYTLTENITLRQLRLIGRGNSYAQYAGQFLYARNVHIYDVEAEFFGDRAFEFIRCLDCSVTSSQMGHGDHTSGLSYGVCVANGCARITVGHSTFMDVRHAVTIGGEDGVDRYVTVTGCAIADCTDSGLDSHPQSQYVSFIGNTIGADGTTASQDGIVVQGANQTVVGNTVQGFERSGILVQNLVTNAAITDNAVVVSGNVVTRPVGSGTVYGIAVENQGTVDNYRFTLAGNTVDVVNVTTSYGISVENLGNTITGGAITGNTVYSRREALTLKTATNKSMRSIAVSGNSLETVDTTTYDVISIQAGSTPNYLERVIITGNSLYGGRYGINNSQGTRIKPDGNMIQGFGTGATNGTFVGTNDNYSS
jgi:hypothetical protein